MKLYVKNMACLSCKVVIKDALEELDILPVKVELGEIETKKDLEFYLAADKFYRYETLRTCGSESPGTLALVALRQNEYASARNALAAAILRLLPA